MIVNQVREQIEKGFAHEAAHHAMRCVRAGVPMTEGELRELVLILADAIAKPRKRGKGQKKVDDPFVEFGKQMMMAEALERRAPGVSVDDAAAAVGTKVHKSESTVKRNLRKIRKST